MKTSEQMTREFHKTLKHPIGERPGPISDERLLLHLRLIAEEVTELMCAMVGVEGEGEAWFKAEAQKVADNLFSIRSASNLVEVANGGCDSHVVISGTLIEFGIPEDKVYKVVHAANMAKVGGLTREDGKSLRPEGWESPDVLKVLLEAGLLDPPPEPEPEPEAPFDPEKDPCPECEAEPDRPCLITVALAGGFPGPVGDCPRDVSP